MKIFWDTNLFIYLWEKTSHQAAIGVLSEFIEREGHVVATSTLTLGEVLVHPARQKQASLVDTYREAFSQIRLIPFTADAAWHFAQLRAAHPSLRPPDAIQWGCALADSCDLFLTNDNRLAAFATAGPVKIQSLMDWAATKG